MSGLLPGDADSKFVAEGEGNLESGSLCRLLGSQGSDESDEGGVEAGGSLGPRSVIVLGGEQLLLWSNLVSDDYDGTRGKQLTPYSLSRSKETSGLGGMKMC